MRHFLNGYRRVLPHRGGSRPVNHSLTYFKNVQLPLSALLGTLEKPDDQRKSFLNLISRVAIGTIAIGSLGIPALQVASYIAAKYSMRRTITDSMGVTKPIISFQTQKGPILIAIAQSFVMKAFHEVSIKNFMEKTDDPRIQHAIATILKVVMMQHSQAANFGLGDRCGAQGLFEVNQLSVMSVSQLFNHLVHGLPKLCFSPTCEGLPLLKGIYWSFQ